MKLKPEFITHTINDTQFLISIDAKAFSGLIQSNASAAFIVDQLKNEVTVSQLVDTMCNKYDADRDTIAADINEILAKLRSVNALED